jgi:hypothetical protein
MSTFEDEVIESMFSDIDLKAAKSVLKELDLPTVYSPEAVAKVDAAANELADQAAKLKHAEAPRSERRAVREQVNRMTNARAFLYRLRPAQPGDVSTTVQPVGGNG